MRALSALGETAELARLAASKAPDLLRTGLLAPVGPQRLRRMATAYWKWGSTPATLCAVAAIRWPERTAVVDELGTLTYAELDRRAGALADALAADYGVGPGTALAVMCRNHRGFIEASVAAGRLGADLLLLNTEFPAAGLAATLERYPIGAVVCDEEFGARFDEAGYAGVRLLGWHEESDELALDDLFVRGAPAAPRPGKPGRVILLTSGTTGVPKGVPRTPPGLATVGPALSALTGLSLRTNEAILIAPPLFHAFGLAFLALGMALGNPVVLRRKFDPELVLSDIQRRRVATMPVVPVMLQRILDLPEDVRDRYSTSSLRAVFSAAAPLTPALAERATAVFGQILYNGYGSSEVGVATIAVPADLAEAPGTVGRAVGGVRVAVLDDAGREVLAGEVGRLFVGSGMTFEGYHGGGGKEVIDGLVNTGDLGHRDVHGRFFVDGRADDMVVSGGENVFPLEVEGALARHETVSDVAVIGVPDEEFGQRLKAFVVPAAGADVDADELKAHLKLHVARYMVPREIVAVAEIPRNATGKVLRAKLP